MSSVPLTNMFEMVRTTNQNWLRVFWSFPKTVVEARRIMHSPQVNACPDHFWNTFRNPHIVYRHYPPKISANKNRQKQHTDTYTTTCRSYVPGRTWMFRKFVFMLVKYTISSPQYETPPFHGPKDVCLSPTKPCFFWGIWYFPIQSH